MSRVLFGQSYYLRFDPKLYAAMRPYPPLGTIYAASFLRKRGHEVALFDAMLAESEDEWGAALTQHRPQCAVLYEDNFNYLSKMCLLRMREAAFRMIGLAKSHGCTVIACGADTTDHPDQYLERGADYAIQGEGETALGQLMEALEGRPGTSIEIIPGLVWRDRNGEIRRNTGRSYISQLDALPFPAWDLVDISQYRRLWKTRHGCFSMNMVTTRGCPYHCNWCAKPIWGQRYNCRSPENVAAEVAWMKREYKPDHIWFADDIFGLKPGWIERFGSLVSETNSTVPFKCQMRADLVTPPVVEGLKRAGCETVWLGAESGSQKVLDAMEKGTTVSQICQARRLLADSGIKTGFFLQFGYSAETRSDIDLTLQMIRDLMPDDIGISVSYPLPGTRFYESVRAQLGEKQNWTDSDDLATLYRSPFPEAFYKALYQATHSEFRLRKALEKTRQERAYLRFWNLANTRTLASIPRHWIEWQSQRRKMRSILAI